MAQTQLKPTKITYDKQADALYIYLQKGVFAMNKEVEEGVILDVGKNNKLLGIEVLNASARLGLKKPVKA